jgi:hypothetical protein
MPPKVVNRLYQSPRQSEPRQAVVASSSRSAVFSCDSDLAHVAKDACAYERTNTHLPSKFGSLAMLLAMRRASSRVSALAILASYESTWP